MTLSICIAAGIGAVLRFLQDAWLNKHMHTKIPLATLVINMCACCLAAIISALAIKYFHGQAIVTLITSGLLGGYSTFSSALLETAKLAQRKTYLLAIAHGLGMFFVCLNVYFMAFNLVFFSINL